MSAPTQTTWRGLEQALITYFRSHGCEIVTGDGEFYLTGLVPDYGCDDVADQLEQVSLSDLARALADDRGEL